ncbi:MAG: OmpA family protein [Thiohalomonadales bacterium]
MYKKCHFICLQFVGVIISTVLISNVALAERERVPGYITNSDGTILRGSSGECMHSSGWTEKMAIVVGCDGVVLKAPTEVDRGKGSGDDVAFVIPSASMFAFDSAELTETGKSDLKAYTAKIKPELAKAFVAVIIGHTDNKGDPKYNLDLSKRRAQSVRDYLIANGALAFKLRIVGEGAKEPIASNDTKEGRAKNRRVEVIVFGEERELDVLSFPSVALFDRNSSELTLRGKQLLDKNKLEAKSKLAKASYIEIIGHTDDVGDKKENQKLSEQRARSVALNLIKAGVDESKIAIVGIGASQPIASNQTEEGRAQNRRVEVFVVGRMK